MIRIRPEDIPYTTATGAVIESGSHLAAFDRVVELGREKLAERVAENHDDGARLGLGFSSYVEGMVPSYLSSSGRWTAQDSCSIRFDADGSVTVSSGVHSMGQGTSTMIATLTAEVLGIPPEDIRVVTGDTDVTPYGLGAWGSRSTGVFSGA